MKNTLLLIAFVFSLTAVYTQQISFTTDSKEEIEFKVSATKEIDFFIDWGDGKKVKYATTQTLNANGKALGKVLIWGENIYAVSISSQQLTKIDVSNCSSLQQFSCAGNKLTEIDVSKNNSLSIFDCSKNNLSSIDLSNNKSLGHLNCQNNNLTSLDLSNNVNIGILACYNNKLTSLDLSKHTKINVLQCYNNYLSIEKFNMPAVESYNDLEISPQHPITLEKKIYDILEEIDLSAQFIKSDGLGNEYETNYTWKTTSGEEVYYGIFVEKNGVFTFYYDQPDSIYCEMTNKAFPDVIFTTKPIVISDIVYSKAKPIITFHTASTNEISFKVISAGTSSRFVIDWGKGDVHLTLSSSFEPRGIASDSVRIYGGEISSFTAENKQLTAIQLKNCLELSQLVITGNAIESLDLSNNVKLNYLNASDNKISKIDLSNCPNLAYLNLNDNKLTALDVSNNSKISYLQIRNNEIQEIDLKNLTSLNNLFCSNNKLNTLDLSTFASMANLSCSYNNLQTLDVSNTSLVFFNCSNNNINSLDLSKSKSILSLKCSNNKLNIATITIPEKEIESYDDYLVSPQQPYTLSKNSFNIFETIDLSSQWTKKDQEGTLHTTEYTWFTESGNILKEDEDFTFFEGKFTFINAIDESIYCKMTNSALPEFVVQTEYISITKSTNKIPQIVIHSELDKISFTPYLENNNGYLLIDFGNKNYTQYFYTGTPIQITHEVYDTIKIYGSDIVVLDIKNQNLDFITIDNSSALTNLYIDNNKIRAIHLQNNKNLSILTANNNDLTSIDVGNVEMLSILKCDNNHLKELDVSNNTNLIELSCENNGIEYLDLHKNLKLNNLFCANNLLRVPTFYLPEKDANFSTSPQSRISLPKDFYTQFEPIDLSSEIRESSVNGNYATTIFAWYSAKTGALLKEDSLYKEENGVFTFIADITDSIYCKMTHASLPNFEVKTNNILIKKPSYSDPSIYFVSASDEEISFSASIADKLGYLYIDWGDGTIKQYTTDNYIVNITGKASDTIKISGSPIVNFHVGNSALSYLDMKNATALETLDCDNNNLRISTITLPNKEIEIALNKQIFSLENEEYSQLEIIDLSSELYKSNSDGKQKTEYVWITHTGDTLVRNKHYKEDNGIFEFLTQFPNGVYCSMQNPALPNFTFITSNIKITQFNQKPSIAFFTENEEATITIQTEIHTSIYIDWGDKTLTEYLLSTNDTAISHVVTDSVKIYGNSILAFTCGEQNISFVNTSNCPTLKSLDCRFNSLETIEISDNTNLTYFNCYENKISSIDFSNNKKLFYINVGNNSFDTIDLSTDTLVTKLYCQRNTLKNLDVSKNTLLEFLDCGENSISSLNVKTNTSLETLYCNGNTLQSINLNRNTALKDIDCSNNLFTSLSLDTNTELTNVNCSNNKILELDLSMFDTLETLNCSYNNLLISTLSLPQSGSGYNYSPQNTFIFPKQSFTVLESVNLTNEAFKVKGEDTYSSTIVWKTKGDITLEENTDYIHKNGVFYFLHSYADSIFCYMKNPLLPDLSIKSELISITELPVQAPVAKFVTESADKIQLSVKANSANSIVQIDWGNGLQNYFADTLLTTILASASDTVFIYGDNISNLNVEGLQISYLHVSNINLNLNCAKNKLTIATLPELKNTKTYIYSPQDTMLLPRKSYEILQSIDLHAQLRNGGINGTKIGTSFIWKTLSGDTLVQGTDYKTTNGIFQFLTPQTEPVQCEMKNPLFPNLILNTNYIHIIDIPKLPLMATMISQSNDSLHIILQGTDENTPIQINWGETLMDDTISTNKSNIAGKATDTVKVYGKGIQTMVVSSQRLTFIELHNADSLLNFDCSKNLLNIATLPIITDKNVIYTYSPQGTYTLPKDYYELNESIDLLSQKHKIDSSGIEKTTSFIWKTKNGDTLKQQYFYTDIISDGGISFFHTPADSVYCEMKNEFFPDLTLKSSLIAIEQEPIQYPALVASAHSKDNASITLHVKSAEDNTLMYIDWGNDTLEEYSVGKKEQTLTNIPADTIKIYADSLVLLNLENTYLDYFSLPPHAKIDTLNCASNNLTIASLPIPLYSKLYTYSNQAKIEFPQNGYKQNESIDLSQQLRKINSVGTEVTTVYSWKTKGGNTLTQGVDYTETDGIFSFNVSPDDSVYCEMQNLALPNLTLQTSFILIENEQIQIPPLAITLYSNAEKEISLGLKATEEENIYIKIGDGNMKSDTVGISLKTISLLPSDTICIYAQGITEMHAQSQKITYIKIEENVTLQTLNCSENNLTIASLPLPNDKIQLYSYAPQATVQLSKNQFQIDESIDLSLQLLKQDSQNNTISTTYLWKTNNGETLDADSHYFENNGIFTFTNAPQDSIYCEMKNELFPELTLKTNNIYIEKEKDTVIQKTDTANISMFTVSNDLILFKLRAINDNTQISIDWGNSVVNDYDISSNINGTSISGVAHDTIKIYADSIDYMYVNNLNISELNIQYCPTLKELYCTNNKLNELNTENNTLLKELHCENNNISNLSIENNIELTEISCENNNLSIATLPKIGNFKYFYAPQKKLSFEIKNYSFIDTVDLSLQLLKLNSTGKIDSTKFTWYTKAGIILTEGEDYTESEGKFLFKKEYVDPIFCIMHNPALPDLTLQTDTIHICGALAKFAVESGCSPYAANNIINTSQNAVSYLWEMGDGTTYETETPIHTYMNNTDTTISYTISLQATSAIGCSHIKDTVIYIFKTPTVNFELANDALFINEHLKLANKTNTFTSKVQSFQWYNKGTEVYNSFDTLTVSFDSIGTKEIGLMVQLVNGCKNIVTKTFEIKDIPDFKLSSSSEPLLCNGDSLTITIDNYEYFDIAWFIENQEQTELKNFSSIIVSQGGTYWATLKGTNTVIKTDSITIQNTIIAKPTIFPDTDKLTICSGETAELTTPYLEKSTIEWYNGINKILEDTNKIKIADSGKYSVHVTLGSCTKISDTVSVSVIETPSTPELSVFGYEKDKCRGDYITIEAKQSDNYPLYWILNKDTIASGTTAMQGILEEGSYAVIGKNSICKSATSNSISISYKESIEAKPRIEYLGQDMWYLACNIDNANEYFWYYNDRLIPNSNKYYYEAGTELGSYRVAINNGNECRSFSDIIMIPENTVFTNISQLELPQNLSLYPIPANETITIEYNAQYFGNVTIDIYSKNGVKVYNQNFIKYGNSFSQSLSLKYLAKGVYYLHISQNNISMRKEIIIE